MAALGTAAGMTSAGCVARRWLSYQGQAKDLTSSSLSQWSMIDRANQAYYVRHRAAIAELRHSLPRCATNGDDDRYATRLASYTKGLPHYDSGAVDPKAYKLLLAAIYSGAPTDFAAVPMGGSLKQVNPQAAHTFALQGADSHRLDVRPAPPFASAEAAADMAEVYWHAVLRDIPFADYPDSSLVVEACRDLTRCSEFTGPRQAAHVVPATLFRGPTSGDLVGPYVSQFLYASVPHGVFTIDQRFRTPAPAFDYMTDPSEWLAIQRGSPAVRDAVLDSNRYFIRTGRDLTRYVHRDYTFQAFLNAALVLISLGGEYVAPNPYVMKACAITSNRTWLTTEEGFCTFGGPQVLDAVAAVARLALLATWNQKWLLHRRLRPEAYAQRVDAAIKHNQDIQIHQDLRECTARYFLKHNNLLLPMAYPEGAPAHPSYPAGHAAIAGACATVLKAYFREDAVFPAPVRVSKDGLFLVPAEEAELTIGGEIDKLASNIAFGRNFAGVHYRSDAVEGMNLGESVALAYLRDARRCLTEEFDGFALTTFSGTPVLV
jgi:membrane-associated phospholipid phosphatase